MAAAAFNGLGLQSSRHGNANPLKISILIFFLRFHQKYSGFFRMADMYCEVQIAHF
jgi:hypothetical protein